MLTPAHFVTHLIATTPLPPPSATLFEYIMAGNGLFLRANRRGLTACLPLVPHTIHGLPTLTPTIILPGPPIPLHIMDAILEEAMRAWRHPGGPVETLFHLSYDTEWRLTIPEQLRRYAAVTPVDPYPPSSEACLIEIHSHHELATEFSATDDDDETGFRIYGVCGDFGRTPSIRFRVGIYGHFFSLPAAAIAELPPSLQDASHRTAPVHPLD